MPRGVFHLRLGDLPPGGFRLRLEKVRWTEGSFQLLAFLNLPEERWETAAMDDPHFADAFFMYGAGEPVAPGREVDLAGSLAVSAELVARVGRPGRNDLVLIPQDLAGQRLDELPVDLSHVVLEPAR